MHVLAVRHSEIVRQTGTSLTAFLPGQPG